MTRHETQQYEILRLRNALDRLALHCIGIYGIEQDKWPDPLKEAMTVIVLDESPETQRLILDPKMSPE